MPVYVDDMRAKYRNLIMCHMIADSDQELHAMADAIGVRRRWWQAPPKHDSHYDICLTKRGLAVAQGAVQIAWKEAAYMCRVRRNTGTMPPLDEVRAYFAERSARFAAAKKGAQGDLFSVTAREPDANAFLQVPAGTRISVDWPNL